MTATNTDVLVEKAREIREMTLDIIGYLGVGHIGGSLSVVEMLTVLYYEKMNVNPQEPRMVGRDWFVMSKGHAGPALYCVLADKGFFPKEWLHTLNVGGTSLPSHCDRNRTPGIDMTTGSLGQGLSAAVGIALAQRLDGHDNWVYACIGDGESQEGQNWEAAMTAAHFKTDRLIAFTDNNKMQIDGLTDEIMSIEKLEDKWAAFNWHVQRIDGHDVKAVSEAVDKAKSVTGRPHMIVMDTIKGKGAAFAEGNLGNHNMVFDYQTAKDAIAALEKEAK
ncbi:MAG: transketolase [Spirochaetaceae bacterium]|nr:transketolase [Spirochaetaceae bacterium]